MLRNALLLSGMIALLTAWGCDSGPETRTTSTGLGTRQTSSGGNTSTTTTNAPPKPRPVRHAHPITEARGKYTVRVTFYYAMGDETAAQLAEKACQGYRKIGYEAYVTDLGNRAILTVGSFNDPDDPQLIATWKREYDNYLSVRGGKESSFQQELDRYYQGAGSIGDRPWPVEIEPLQMRMKLTYGTITQEQWNKYLQSRATVR